MSNRTICITDALHDWLLRETLREPEILARLRAETAGEEMSRMQIAPEQGQFMALLARLIDARRYLEIGVYTGYSSLAVALAMPEDGRITACDISEHWTATARRYWTEAGVDHRIDLRLAPAAETLAALLKAGERSTYDFAFVDADKVGYDDYYERCLELVRPGGVIAFDNCFWGGAVADPAKRDEETEALRRLARKLREDGRVDFSLVPIGDGMGLARRR